MAFDWQEFLHLAERLLESDTEAAYRSAISRAYYSFFNAAFERAQRNNCCNFDSEDRNKGMHVRCWGVYKKGPDPDCRKLGVEGDRLRDLRVRADYKSAEYRRLREDAAQFIKDVRALSGKLAALDVRYPAP